MKKPRMTVATFLMAFLVSALVAFSCLMCLVDAFALGSNPVTLLAWSFGVAFLSTGAMWFRRAGWISAVAGVVFLGLIVWFRAALLESFQGILHAVTSEYAICYSVPVRGLEGADPTAFLLFLAVPLAWLTAWSVSREGSALLVLLACMPVLILCLIIVDIAPIFWLILLTGLLVLLLLSQGVRERNPSEGSRLAWWLVLPTVILVAGITVLWPPAAYERADWSETLQALAETKVNLEAMEAQVFSSVPRWSASLKTVDLSQIGPRVTTGRLVLQYQADSEISYLRGVSLGVYADNAWSAVPQSEFLSQSFDPMPDAGSPDTVQTLALEVSSREPMLYTTYYLAAIPQGGEAVDDAYIGNPDRMTAYEVSYFAGSVSPSAAYDAYVRNHYTQVPEELLPTLQSIAGQAGLSRASTPRDVAAYVRQSGTYDVNTPQIPSGKDFVLYFLQESHQGYCVHFASATVLLLRALDIPARYVTGYLVSGDAGQWNNVTDESAHAWVEYYVEGTGWLPLDPTPAADETEPEPDETTVSTEDEPVPTPDSPEAQNPEGEPAAPEAESNHETPEDAVAVIGGADMPTSLILSGHSLKWLWLLAFPALLGLIALRRWLVLRRRKDRCTRGHPNRRALTLWRWLVRLSKTDGTPLPEELLCLAEKAKFSQHTLTEEELAQLQEALDERIQALSKAPIGKRLWDQFGLTLF